MKVLPVLVALLLGLTACSEGDASGSNARSRGELAFSSGSSRPQVNASQASAHTAQAPRISRATFNAASLASPKSCATKVPSGAESTGAPAILVTP